MPPRRATPQSRLRARQLRKEPTPAERALWAVLRGEQLGARFRRQHALGPYIVDFCCIKKKLVIEVDGSQHLQQAEYDEARTVFLASQGYRVLRFWNHDVQNNLNDVVRAIQLALQEAE